MSIAPTRRKLIEAYPDAVIVGLTATPARGDGLGLGQIFDSLVLSWPMKRLIDAGYLVPLRYWAPSAPDLEGLKTGKDGDYVVSALEKRVDKPQLIGDIVDNWFRIAGDRRTVVFCTTKSHSRHIRDAFIERGVRAEHVGDDTPLAERQAILARVDSGQTQVLTNVFVASYGLDIPGLECAVLARPTRNLTLYLQTVGRIMRPAPGKTHGVVIDHSGAVKQHGFADEEIPWSLEGDEKLAERREKQKAEKGEAKVITCPECHTQFKGTRICPQCGHECIPKGKPVPVYEADLEEVSPTKANRGDDWEYKAEFYAQLLGYARARGYKMGWAAYQYREKYGVWPNDRRVRNVTAQAPGLEIYNWVKHVAIKRRKAQQAQEKREEAKVAG